MANAPERKFDRFGAKDRSGSPAIGASASVAPGLSTIVEMIRRRARGRPCAKDAQCENQHCYHSEIFLTTMSNAPSTHGVRQFYVRSAGRSRTRRRRRVYVEKGRQWGGVAGGEKDILENADRGDGVKKIKSMDQHHERLLRHSGHKKMEEAVQT